jgi:hypothetical protein
MESIYVISKKEYFLKALLRSGLVEDCHPYLVYKKDKAEAYLEVNVCDVVSADTFFDLPLDSKYDSIVRMLWCLSKQQKALNEEGYAFYGLDLKDIVVLNSNVFLLLNVDFVREKRGGGGGGGGGGGEGGGGGGNGGYDCFFFSPLIKNDFSSDEVMSISTLPNKVRSSAAFDYSLGVLAFFLLSGKKYKKGLDMNLRIELRCIYKTRLYWMILSALEKRMLILL